MKIPSSKTITFASLIVGTICFSLFFILEYALTSKYIAIVPGDFYLFARKAFLIAAAFCYMLAMLTLVISLIITMWKN